MVTHTNLPNLLASVSPLLEHPKLNLTSQRVHGKLMLNADKADKMIMGIKRQRHELINHFPYCLFGSDIIG